MTARRALHGPRFSLFRGWWIAIAQNVAPRWFHARERRRYEEENRRLLSSSDLPTFALVGAPAGEVVAGEVVTRVLSASLVTRRAGLLRLRRVARGGVTQLCTTQPTPGGGELRITSERRRPDVETAPAGRERVLMIHNFLARSGISGDARVERREIELSPGMSYRLLTVSEDAWTPFRFVVDGEPQDSERITLGYNWLAIGTVADVAVAIEGHHFDPDRLELVRLDRGVSY